MISVKQIEDLGLKYEGVVVDEKHPAFPKYKFPVHKFSIKWSECPPDAKCNDHFYGEVRVFGEVLGKSLSIPYIRIEILEQGGFIGMNQDRVAFDGHIDNIEQVKILFEILHIKKHTFL